jgi:hypothetical protein
MDLSLLLTSVQACDCKTLTLTDNTGVYHVTDNPGGWDPTSVNNPNYNDVKCAYLQIYLPSDTLYTTPYYVDITSIFRGATSLDDLVFEVDMMNLGGAPGDTFADGVYKITYKIGTDIDNPGVGDCNEGFTASVVTYVPLYCVVQCCIIKKIVKVPQYYCCDQCKNEYVMYSLGLFMML